MSEPSSAPLPTSLPTPPPAPQPCAQSTTPGLPLQHIPTRTHAATELGYHGRVEYIGVYKPLAFESWKSWYTYGSTSAGFGAMEELAYIRVYKPLPGVKEICLTMKDSAAKLATPRCGVRAGSRGAGLSHRVQLRLAASTCKGGHQPFRPLS